MKQLHLLLFFALSIYCANAQTSTFVISKYNEYCIAHTLQKNETLASLALSFNVPVNKLYAFNGMQARSVAKIGQTIYIPLVENNYIKDVNYSVGANDIELKYHLNENEFLATVCNKLNTKKENVLALNPTYQSNMKEADLTIGWVKYISNESRNNKVVFETKKEVFKKDAISVEKNISDKNVYPIKNTATRNTKNENIQNKNLRNKYKEELDQKENFSSKLKKIFSKKTKENTWEASEPVLVKNDPNRSIHKLSKYFSKDNKNEKQSEKEDEIAAKNSYQTYKSKETILEKNTTKVVIQPTRNNTYKGVEKNVIPSKEKSLNPNAIVEKTKSNVEPDANKVKVASTPKVDIVEDKTIRNEVKALSLSQSKMGNASYFFTGVATGKFYVVTNVAQIGEVIKVTNINNGKSIFAEVLDALPFGDSKKGLLIKLSDNAKMPLGQNNGFFNVKVNY